MPVAQAPCRPHKHVTSRRPGLELDFAKLPRPTRMIGHGVARSRTLQPDASSSSPDASYARKVKRAGKGPTLERAKRHLSHGLYVQRARGCFDASTECSLGHRGAPPSARAHAACAAASCPSRLGLCVVGGCCVCCVCCVVSCFLVALPRPLRQSALSCRADKDLAQARFSPIRPPLPFSHTSAALACHLRRLSFAASVANLAERATMPVELRKRKAPQPPPAPAPVAKKAAKPGRPPKPKKPEPAAKKEDEKPSAAAAAAPAAAATPSSKKVAVGQVIDLDGFGGEIQTNDGETTTLKKLLEESGSGVVLFTYPKASTPGCKFFLLFLFFSLLIESRLRELLRKSPSHLHVDGALMYRNQAQPKSASFATLTPLSLPTASPSMASVQTRPRLIPRSRRSRSFPTRCCVIRRQLSSPPLG
ncbi:thioredoxin peroxidase dot5 [Metarhizium acridum]|uniref:thioredoxin peroxidase dot5 n=1 Tax=Metarhizium acridum TaxID=92637 RepID=UPI001C6C567F|nr:thioredoxin peroxidase dot5 [Metarhizium acridum]